MSPQAQFNAILRNARRDALKVLVAHAKEVLPKDWTLHLAVGWGLCLNNAEDDTVFDTCTDAPARLPKGVRNLMLMAADFFDTFGPENERITSKGLSYPPPRRILGARSPSRA